MALAEFFQRNAVAASQIIAGYDQDTFVSRISSANVGIAFGEDAVNGGEGRHLIDMLIRLVCRLYPNICLIPDGTEASRYVEVLRKLALEINPLIGFDAGAATHVISVGRARVDTSILTSYAGSNAWDALNSELEPQPVGNSSNPFGPGAAACFAAANVFNKLFLTDEAVQLFAQDGVFSTLDGNASRTEDNLETDALEVASASVLVGGGAIGNAAIWALSRSGTTLTLHLVDHETIELSNLQRYVMAVSEDVNHSKVHQLSRFSTQSLTIVPHAIDWANFVATNGYHWDQVLAAVDTANIRRLIQASLPKAVLNAWTQQGDLGISQHGTFGSDVACLSCLYLPQTGLPGEDQFVAQALGIPDRLLDVRTLLHLGLPVPSDLLQLITQRLQIEPSLLTGFGNAPIRRLYVEGICGGVLVPPSSANPAVRNLHVPMAHQSALAGILLAAAAIRQAARPAMDVTRVTRVDVTKPLSHYATQAATADESGRCICRDTDYVAAYLNKYSN